MGAADDGSLVDHRKAAVFLTMAGAIQVSERTVGLWLVEYPMGDFVLVASRTDDGAGEMICCFRTRGVRGNPPTEEWLRVIPGEQGLIEASREAARKVARDTGGKQWEILRGKGSLIQFLDQISNLPIVRPAQLSS